MALAKGCITSRETRQARVFKLGTTKNASNDTQEREFTRYYYESYGLVYNYVRSRMANDAAAEDVVSEAFLKAARSFGSFDPKRAKFSTWVITIAKNCMISHFRKQRFTVGLEDTSEVTYAVGGEQEHVDNMLLVKQLLACLDDEERELVALKYRDGLRNVEIARELGMNQSTVSTKLFNAMAKMRKELGQA